MKSILKSNEFVGIALGVSCGLLVRVMFEWRLLSNVFEIISTGFLIFAPISVGAISVYFSHKDIESGSASRMGVAAATMLFFLVSMFLLLLEGLVCIILVAPVFMIASLMGGAIMGLVLKYTKKSNGVVSCIAILPFALSFAETLLPVKPGDTEVRNSIEIDASADLIFHKLYNVSEISSDELGFSFMHLVGLPRPIEAQMDATGIGAVRTSRWGKGVEFQERITEWEASRKMMYEFIIPKGSIPRDALDRHVELGGEYFTVVSGGYEIECASAQRCTLHLHTVYRNSSRLQLYGNIWAHIVLSDFHSSILGLMKNRAETKEV